MRWAWALAALVSWGVLCFVFEVVMLTVLLMRDMGCSFLVDRLLLVPSQGAK